MNRKAPLAIAAIALALTACQPTGSRTVILTDEFGQIIDTGDNVRHDIQLNGTRPEARNEELCEAEWGGLWISEKYVCEDVQYPPTP